MCNGKLYGKSLSTVNVSVNCSKAALNECVKKETKKTKKYPEIMVSFSSF